MARHEFDVHDLGSDHQGVGQNVMTSHMMKYHIAIPLLVVVALVVVGMPFGSALGAGMAAGCMSMMLMMVTGHGHGHHASSRHTEHHADATTEHR